MPDPDYGLDAPGNMRALAVRGAVCLTVGLGAGWWRSHGGGPWLAYVRSFGIGAGATQLAVAAWMWWSSRYGKMRVVRALLDMHDWRGDERVLDVGCGRGLALIGAAERLTRGGHATGVDLWAASDLSGNDPAATRANAMAAKVADRVTIDTGDARALPYPDASFDVVVSMTAIHNIADAAGREQALGELLRVLRPSGRLLIFDIFHPFAYLAYLRRLGARNIRWAGPIMLWAVPGVRIAADR